MFHYYCLLYSKSRKSIIPIAIFTYDTLRYNDHFSISFDEEEVIQYKYYPLHLKPLNWRNFIRKENPVSAVLLSKMGYNESEKVQVKLEFLRIMSKLKIDKEKQSFLLRLFEVYLKLTPEVEAKLIAEIKKDEETFDISSLPISFIEWGKEIGREEDEKAGWETSREQVALKMFKKTFLRK